VTPRPGVRDPQAEAVSEALQGLGPQRADSSVQVSCVGRYLLMQIEAATAAAAQTWAEQMCSEMLVNPNLESYQLRIEATAA